MTMRNQGLVKTFNAGAALGAALLVKFGADERTVVPAAAVGDSIIGVSDNIDAASGDVVDVVLSGVATVRYGGTVAAGDWLTTNASGQAVVANPAAGANNNVIGRAMVAGSSGDLGAVLISVGRIQG
jgi:hypothetical protein